MGIGADQSALLNFEEKLSRVVYSDILHTPLIMSHFLTVLMGPFVPKQNRVPRGPPGGYHNQHGGYRPSGPPQQWGPPSAPPPSYGGYSQATQYPGPQQYQGPPQAYGAYSQQPSSGYTSSGWDQRSPATAAQPLHQGSYDYYAQQGQQVIYFASNRAKFYLHGVRFHHYPTCFVGYVACVLS